MADRPSGPLADVYAAWSSLRGVTVADVQRASGLARHTIESIRDGGGRQPARATLRRLAIGLATDPQSGRYHENIMKRVYRDLLVAGRYADPNADDARSLMDLALYYRFRDPAKAHAWAALLDRFEALEPGALGALVAPSELHKDEDLSIE